MIYFMFFQNFNCNLSSIYRVKLARGPNGEKVAMKIFPHSVGEMELNQVEAFYSELMAMGELDHQHLTKLVKFNEAAEAITRSGQKVLVSYIVMDYADEGNLLTKVTKAGKLTEKEAREMFHQLVDTLEYMHRKGFYHRDIKPDNLLLDSTKGL